ncbi:peptidase M20 domain-containing protein 2-like [Actinia tenebrosa]|uniref:Peptidase M20 domain-containing protein 2 n=1 Tax=Actinia tenebrosa TaxID=6105 RepID=A0A6P8IJB9_ACTTE|nr:peptidase M20 domain-containing protein 2-like [Actinia tenebrosa]
MDERGLQTLKEIASKAIDNIEKELFDLNQKIWKTPELGFEEKFAHSALTDFLEKAGFEVSRGFGGLDTAFRAVSGKSHKLSVGILCEYDALPGIGHACGHNLISEAGVGAAIGLKAALEAAGIELGRVVVQGTPAEEGGGGKIIMINNGCFDDLDICMMVHPKPFNCIYPTCLARREVTVTYNGYAAHAAAFPWEGINALDAAIMAYNSVSVMRQQMKPTWRVHGILTNGGVKPNIIPDKTSLLYYIRTPTESEMDILRDKVQLCFEAAAKATGCSVNMVWSELSYSNVTTNEILGKLYQENAEQFGLTFPPRSEQEKAAVGSTDMGNVSHVKPSIHPYFDIDTAEPNHTEAFTAASGRKEAHRMTLIQCKVLASVALDVMCKKGLIKEVQDDFDRAHK